MTKKLFLFGICALLAVHLLLQLVFAIHENQTIDEGVHLSSGYSYLIMRDFRLNPEHPALAKEIAALPLLFVQPTLPVGHESWMSSDQWEFARQFMYHSGNNPELLLLLGRLPIILMSVLLGALIARWAFERSGIVGAFFSTLVYAFSPIFLAHGHLITTDIPVTLGFTACVYAFTKWIRYPFKKWAILTVAFFVFTILVKFTGLILIFILPIVYLISSLSRANQPIADMRKKITILFASILVCSLLGIGLTTFGSTSTFIADQYHGLQRYQETSEQVHLSSGIKHAAFSGYSSFLKSVPVFGYPYLNGLLMFMDHNNGGHESYFLGKYTDTGNVWYFPVSFLIKTPASVLICITLLFAIFVKQTIFHIRFVTSARSCLKRCKNLLGSYTPEGIALFIFPVIYLAFSMASHVNIGVRHIAPMFPFIFIGIAQLFSIKVVRQKVLMVFTASILLINLITIFWVFPFPMSYFSEIIGGPKQGHTYMLDSNIDWGEKLKYLKKYMQTQKISQICYSYFGQGNLIHEGIQGAYLPTTQDISGRKSLDCVVVISAQSLYSRHGGYSWLTAFTPTTTIGYGIYIYDFRKNDIEKSGHL